MAGLLSTLFDIGGAAGGPILGILSDSRGKTLEWLFRACLCACLALVSLILFAGHGIIILGTWFIKWHNLNSVSYTHLTLPTKA